VNRLYRKKTDIKLESDRRRPGEEVRRAAGARPSRANSWQLNGAIMTIKQMRDIPGTTFFDGPMSTKGYPLNKMLYSFNSEAGREVFKQDEEACMEKFKLTKAQKQCVRDRDVLGLIREGGSIYYLAKVGPILNLNVQDFGGLQTGQTTEEFQAYLDSQGIGKHNG
jgi:protocatechuate 4,5-dioxygenase, alpha chain